MNWQRKINLSLFAFREATSHFADATLLPRKRRHVSRAARVLSRAFMLLVDGMPRAVGREAHLASWTETVQGIVARRRQLSGTNGMVMNGKAPVVMLLVAMAVSLGFSSRAEADPIKIAPTAVTASSTASGNSPWNAVDGNSGTVWNSGASPTQWILLDLGRPMAISKIRLQVSQSTAGWTSHYFDVGPDLANLRVAGTYTNIYTADSGWIEYGIVRNNNDPLGNVRYVRIETTKDPSAVAWREIEVYSSVEYFGYFGVGPAFPETAALGANLGWVTSSQAATNHDDMVQALAATRNAGGKAVVYLNYEVYKCGNSWQGLCDGTPPTVGGACPSGVPQTCPEWGSHLDALMAQIKSAGLEDSMAAFYLDDEPHLNDSFVLTNLSKVAEHVHLASWSKPIALTLAAGEVVNELANLAPADLAKFQSSFDWVGFDCYGDWDRCGQWAGESWQTSLVIATLRAKLTAKQRMLVVPTGNLFNSYNQSTLVRSADRWNKELLSDGKYIAVLPYEWNINAQSTKYLPLVRERLKRLAHSLLAPGDPLGSPLHASMTTASPSGFGRDGYHLDKLGRLWHQDVSSGVWSLVASPPSTRLSGGLERLTNPNVSNFDSIVTVGDDGHVYQYLTQSGSDYGWHDIGLPTACDGGVVGNPTTATGANGNLDISYGCYNLADHRDHIGTAY
jgi:hypothetical protein